MSPIHIKRQARNTFFEFLAVGTSLFVWASANKIIQNTVRGATKANPANTDFAFSLFVLLLVFGALQIIAPTYTRDTFQTIKVLCKIKPEVMLSKALRSFLKILSDKKMQDQMFVMISDAIEK